ncbi:MAG: hypothetical protein J6X26_02555, partial [Bacteroidales bacterium]|nr:hypothetical protein [Bacteroidales bacterium]
MMKSLMIFFSSSHNPAKYADATKESTPIGIVITHLKGKEKRVTIARQTAHVTMTGINSFNTTRFMNVPIDN